MWEKKKLRIKERDDWRCVLCADTETGLEVHHTVYDEFEGVPWNVPDDTLFTLCKHCHKKAEKQGGWLTHVLNMVMFPDREEPWKGFHNRGFGPPNHAYEYLGEWMAKNPILEATMKEWAHRFAR